MPKICYKPYKFGPSALKVVSQANDILSEYQARGIVVTLRQLYYQFVSRDLIANKQSEYKRLGTIINDARLAGLIDWDHLQDRTRNLQVMPHWGTPGGIIRSAAYSYHRDLWNGQDEYVEVWIEKDALIGVIENICNRLDVPYFSCRGYTSQSEMWSASQRLLAQVTKGRKTTIIHLGDHDPSGRDMSRDIEDRLVDFIHHHSSPGARLLHINRIALNMDQVDQYNPPPNPAKLTDTRATKYVEEFGDESWELDALDPDVLTSLIETEIQSHLDMELFESQKDRQETERELLVKVSDNWGEVVQRVEEI